MANPITMVQGGIFAALLLIAAVTDLRRRIIPDAVCVAIALCGMLRFEPSNALGILIAAPFFVAALCGTTGGGDVKLTAAAGFVLGLPTACAAMIIGLPLMLPTCGIHWITAKVRGKSPCDYPLAPFLAIGCIAAFLITNLYGGIVL